MDPRTPVIVGVGQINEDAEATEPLDLVETASRRAIADSGANALPIDLVALSKIGTHPYQNAPGLLAARLGHEEARTLQASHGGHTSQVVLLHAAFEISQGRCETALIAGGELGSALKKPRADGARSDHESVTPRTPFPDLAIGDDLSQWIAHPQEQALGIEAPICMYPIMETALGAALGRTREEHIAELGQLWARFSDIASNNEFAVDRVAHRADEITSATPANRFVGYPYTKLMNSNQFVDQGAAILVCSVAAAREHGIPRDRWVFPLAGTTAHSAFVSERANLHDAPALSMAARSLESLVGRPLHEFELVDLYACFPFAVQVQARALGLSLDRDLTLTGGMRFAGGPWNNYGTHMIANLVERVRERPEAMAVCSTNGGLATRFCVTAYSGTPNESPFRTNPLPLVDTGHRRFLETRPEGQGRIEGYTVRHDRGNAPVDAVAACLLDNGARAWAMIRNERDVLAMLEADPIGESVAFGADGATLA